MPLEILGGTTGCVSYSLGPFRPYAKWLLKKVFDSLAALRLFQLGVRDTGKTVGDDSYATVKS